MNGIEIFFTYCFAVVFTTLGYYGSSWFYLPAVALWMIAIYSTYKAVAQ